MSKKTALYILCGLAAVSAALYLAAASAADLRGQVFLFQALALGLFLIYLMAAWLVVSQRPPGRMLVGAIILGAITFRLIMAFGPPTLSDDIYRYVWDGKIQAAGFSPYAYAPDAPELIKLRHRGGFNKLDDNAGSKAVYQPAAQILFLASAPFGANSAQTLKIIFILLDIAVILLLRKILVHLKRPPGLIVLYAWCPLVVFEIAGSGHVDSLAVFFAVAAVYLALRQKRFAAGLLIGAAAATKLYPILLLPAVMREKKDWRTAAGAAAALILLYAPYLVRGGTLLAFAGGTSEGPSFNPGLKSLLILANGTSSPGVDNAYALLALAALAAAGLYAWSKRKSDEGIIRAAFLMSAAIIVLLPYTVPWYITLVLPFAAVELAGSFIWLSGAVMLSYLYYAWEPWGLPAWITAVQFVPFFGLLLAELRAVKRGRQFPLYCLIDKNPVSLSHDAQNRVR